MLDYMSKKLLNILHGECKHSAYKVFSFAELALFLPKNDKIDEEELRNLLKNLSVREYISIRYEDESEVCLCMLPDGRAAVENDFQESVVRERTAKGLFTYSFIGGVAGGIFTAIIFVALYFLIGGV